MADGRLVRVKLAFERNFTQIPNDWIRDGSISLKARGLLGLLMSHEEGFVITHKQLERTNPEGHTAIQAAVQELKQHGYLEVSKDRGRNGRIDGWVWMLTDPAVRAKGWSQPELGYPDVENEHLDLNTGYPDVDNQHLKEAHSEEQLTHLLETGGSTGAQDEVDALTRAAVPSPVREPETYEERYNRLLHQPCPYRHDGHEHARHGEGGTCVYCGLSGGEYFDDHRQVQRLDQLVDA